jgi:L-asparaginase / beta-aspartyl-peptidase
MEPAPGRIDSPSCNAQDRFTLIVHGGTVARRDRVTPAQLELIRCVVEEGRERLEAGATALETVVRAVAALEDSGLLDAGKGSYLNTDGFVENDAALMEGHTGRAGAVAAMRRIRNPIEAAAIVMRRTSHVLLVGSSGEATLARLGAALVDDPVAYFKPYVEAAQRVTGEGTVGAVALDRCGHLAAATSTGGTPDKSPGRVGDSPIIGAGTFANERCALSATGIGEHFIRRCAAFDIAMRAQYLGASLRSAADHVVRTLIGGVDKAAGAIIAVGLDGEPVVSANGFGVLHGYASDATSVTVDVRAP